MLVLTAKAGKSCGNSEELEFKTTNGHEYRKSASIIFIGRDFCGHSNAVCEDYRIPKLVHAAINLVDLAMNPAAR